MYLVTALSHAGTCHPSAAAFAFYVAENPAHPWEATMPQNQPQGANSAEHHDHAPIKNHLLLENAEAPQFIG